MIAQSELIGRIKQDFSLNIYEVKIWTALLSRGIATAGELADISGVPRSRCYDVLESLEKKGFIIMKIGRPIKYIAVQPDEVVSRVKKEVTNQADIDYQLLEAIKDTDIFKELELLHKSGIEHIDATELSNEIIGRDNINHFTKKFIAGAKKRVVIGTTSEGLKREAGPLKNILKLLNKRGVKVKVMAPLGDAKSEKLLKGIAELKAIDTGVRFVNVDDTELLFMASDDSIEKSNDIGIWVKSEFFTKALSEMLERSLE